jgi:hypothetical protein
MHSDTGPCVFNLTGDISRLLTIRFFSIYVARTREIGMLRSVTFLLGIFNNFPALDW